MYQLTTEHSFDSAHFLAGYTGKCANLHGHRWRVLLTVESEKLQTDQQHDGMCVDFAELKADLHNLLDSMDHILIIEKGSLMPETSQALQAEGFPILELPFRPTAENFAKYFYDYFIQMQYRVAQVQVYETPNNCATYQREMAIRKEA